MKASSARSRRSAAVITISSLKACVDRNSYVTVTPRERLLKNCRWSDHLGPSDADGTAGASPYGARRPHQAVQNGYMVKLAKGEGFSYPVPQIIATYPGEKTTPACNKMTFED